jgi:hypothetical protein
MSSSVQTWCLVKYLRSVNVPSPIGIGVVVMVVVVVGHLVNRDGC